MKNTKTESTMEIEIEHQDKSQVKRSSISQRLFKRRHHFTKPIVKSRFLRRTRHIQKKSNQFNVDVVFDDS